MCLGLMLRTHVLRILRIKGRKKREQILWVENFWKEIRQLQERPSWQEATFLLDTLLHLQARYFRRCLHGYPITVMTGHSIAEVIISPDKIEYTGIENPEYYLIISEEGAARVRNKIEALHATTTVVCNEIILPETKAKVIRFPFRKIAKEMGKLTIGTISVASLISHSGIFPTEAFKKAINFYQKPSIAETNIKAVDAGIGLCKSL
jgi:hypothetical protein